MNWVGPWSAPSHYLNQCWSVVNWTLRNKLKWNSNQYTKLLFMVLLPIMSSGKMVAILSKGVWVNQGLSGPNLVILAWTGGELLRGQARDFQWPTLYTHTQTDGRALARPRVTLYTAGHLHTAVPHCSHSRAPIVHTAVPRENNEHGCVYLRCRAVCKLPGCVEGHPWIPAEQNWPLANMLNC